ncbi:MAG: hypothetical protein ABW044_05250 [Cellvibrio sp.]
MKNFFLYLVCAAWLFTTTFVVAETIRVPVGSQSTTTQQTNSPKKGSSKAQVKSEFGEPLKENPAKGQPPISSWEYAEFKVYFEYDHVIHSVAKPKLRESKETVIETTDEMSEDDLKLDK